MRDHIVNLPNGIRVLVRPLPSTRVVHVGFVIDAGSKDEKSGQHGLAHFIEHIVFKGTARRKTFHILNYLESVGGDLNAYTTKEKTCFYASLSGDFLERAIDLLSDILFHSTFPEKEMLKEKQVIKEEIEMYRDSPEEAIFEDFDKLLFPHHPLGRPILGTPDSVSAFTRREVKEFMKSHYTAPRIVVSITGAVKPAQAEEICRRYLGGLRLPGRKRVRRHKPLKYEPRHKVVKHPHAQAHQIIGAPAYPLRQGNYVPFYLLNNHLGGPAMNSLLTLNIREKFGLAYNIYSFYSPYAETGQWGVYFACEPKNRERIADLTMRELKALRREKPGTLRLAAIKRQMIGQLVMSSESALTQMLVMGKNYLDFGRDHTLEEMIAQVEKVTASSFLATANDIFDEKKLSSLAYVPNGK